MPEHPMILVMGERAAPVLIGRLEGCRVVAKYGFEFRKGYQAVMIRIQDPETDMVFFFSRPGGTWDADQEEDCGQGDDRSLHGCLNRLISGNSALRHVARCIL